MKKISRKDFINLSAASALSIPLFGFNSFGNKNKSNEIEIFSVNTAKYADNLGFQVFALRDLLVDNASSLFKSLANVGIKSIEFFDPATLNEYVPIVKDCGMKPLATHLLPGYISGNWETAKSANMAPPDNYNLDNVIEDCHKNEVEYLGIAIMFQEDRQELDDYKKFAEKTNLSAEKCKSAGIQLFYHNHSFEFEPMLGTTPYEEMLKIFDPKLVKLELDVFWITVAGLNPIFWLQKLSDRILFLHMKDLKKKTQLGYYGFDLPEDIFVELGTGMLDFKNILEETHRLNIEYAIIDQDSTQMNDKIASVKKNCDFIKSLEI